MSTPITHDGDTQRPMNEDELAAFNLMKADAESQAQADADKAKLKADTLAKLGLTADEVAALLS